MGDSGYYACCPKCGRPVVKSKRCDGMELKCSKCGSELRVFVNQTAMVVVEIVEKQNKNSITPGIVGLG